MQKEEIPQMLYYSFLPSSNVVLASSTSSSANIQRSLPGAGRQEGRDRGAVCRGCGVYTGCKKVGVQP